MQRFKTYFLTTVGLLVLVCTIALISARPGLATKLAQTIWIKDTDNPAQEPVFAALREVVPDGQYYSATWDTIYTVPAGKRFVLEYIEVNVQNAQGPQAPALLLSVPGAGSPGSATDDLVLFADAKTGSSFSSHQLVRIYYAPGEVVVARAYRAASPVGDALYSFKLHGHLVDLAL